MLGTSVYMLGTSLWTHRLKIDVGVFVTAVEVRSGSFGEIYLVMLSTMKNN